MKGLGEACKPVAAQQWQQGRGCKNCKPVAASLALWPDARSHTNWLLRRRAPKFWLWGWPWTFPALRTLHAPTPPVHTSPAPPVQAQLIAPSHPLPPSKHTYHGGVFDILVYTFPLFACKYMYDKRKGRMRCMTQRK